MYRFHGRHQAHALAVSHDQSSVTTSATSWGTRLAPASRTPMVAPGTKPLGNMRKTRVNKTNKLPKRKDMQGSLVPIRASLIWHSCNRKMGQNLKACLQAANHSWSYLARNKKNRPHLFVASCHTLLNVTPNVAGDVHSGAAAI